MHNIDFRVSYANELYHHGILNMKWGVRRFQNPDGSLTPAGKKRYSKRLKNTKSTKTKSKPNVANKNETPTTRLFKGLQKYMNVNIGDVPRGRVEAGKLQLETFRRNNSDYLQQHTIHAIQQHQDFTNHSIQQHMHMINHNF